MARAPGMRIPALPPSLSFFSSSLFASCFCLLAPLPLFAPPRSLNSLLRDLSRELPVKRHSLLLAPGHNFGHSMLYEDVGVFFGTAFCLWFAFDLCRRDWKRKNVAYVAFYFSLPGLFSNSCRRKWRSSKKKV